MTTTSIPATQPLRNLNRLVLRLYVAGQSPHSSAAKANLTALLHGHQGEVDLEVVDVFDSPTEAMASGVLVTPTLIKLAPSPQRKIIGNLSDGARVLEALGLATGGDVRG